MAIKRSEDRLADRVTAFAGSLNFVYIHAVWFGRGRWRDLFRPAPVLLFLLVAAPWHIACALRNGPIFLWTLFVLQQFQRFVSPSLQHVQGWWFYIPLLPAAFFPWTPVLALLVRRDLYSDKRLQFMLGVAAWGFIFFSASTNKLPGYLLPLMPPLAVVAGVALERTQLAGRIAIGLSALACCGFPVLVRMLPVWMSRNPKAAAPEMPISLAVLLLLGVLVAAFIRNRPASLALVASLAFAGYLWIKVESLPFVDAAATARPVARQIQAAGVPVCVKDVPRDWHYGLNYYADKVVPNCPGNPPPPAFVYYRDHRLLVQFPRPY